MYWKNRVQKPSLKDEERNVIPAAQRTDLQGFLQERLIVQILFPELDAGRTALQGVLHLFIQSLLPCPGTVSHRVKQHGVPKFFFAVSHKFPPVPRKSVLMKV